MPGIDDVYPDETEPSGAQVGIDAPGQLAAISDYTNFGLYNGGFRVGPPNPAANIDLASSTSGSNFIPGWRFVASSNSGNVTVTHQRSTASASGSNVRFTFVAGGLASDEAFLEQTVEVGGSATRAALDLVRASYLNSTTGMQGFFQTQYLTADGTITGMPAQEEQVLVGPQQYLGRLATPTSLGVPAARYLRVRVGARRGTASTATSHTLDVYEVRRERGATGLILTDGFDPQGSFGDAGAHLMQLIYEDLRLTNQRTGATHLLNYSLVPLHFSLLNVPANATTRMQIADVALGMTTPRISVGFPGSVVGVSYRMSAAITAGGATALRLQATVGGTNVWNAHTLTTSSAQFDAATQAVGTDTFTGFEALGIDVTTSSTFAPTSLDIAAILWLAVKWRSNP